MSGGFSYNKAQNAQQNANVQDQGQAGQNQAEKPKSSYGLGQNNLLGNRTNRWSGGLGQRKLGVQNTNLLQEEMLISKIEEDSEKNPDLKNALRIIIDLNDRVNKYGQKMKPLEGSEAFEKKLDELKDDTNRAIVHTIMALAREIDHGNEIISEYRDKLETFKFYSDTAKNGSRALPSPFLIRYYDNLKKRTNDITRSIQSFTEYLDSSSNLQSPQMLTYVLQQQNEAIIRCSARISQIKTKSEEIQKEIKDKLKSKGFTDKQFGDESNTERSSYSKTVMDEYEKFKDNRDRDLKKRNPDREQWKKPQQQKMGLGGGIRRIGTGAFGMGNFGRQNRQGLGTGGGAAGVTGAAGGAGGAAGGAAGGISRTLSQTSGGH